MRFVLNVGHLLRERDLHQEPEQAAGVICGAGAGFFGFLFGGPAGAGAAVEGGYYVARRNMTWYNYEYSKTQMFKFKCPKCGTKWKARLLTNENPSVDNTHPLCGV